MSKSPMEHWTTMTERVRPIATTFEPLGSRLTSGRLFQQRSLQRGAIWNRFACGTFHARVYPMPGPFLNPVALSNIERYPRQCERSGAEPRPFFLRNRSGNLVNMQPSMKTAQSLPARSQSAANWARAA